MDEQQELELLRKFYDEVRNLTVNHDVENDTAVVYADKLSEALSHVNPNWCEVCV